jgi:hypothetical protein
MKLSHFLQSKAGKFLFPFVALIIVIGLVKAGYNFGQWLHLAIN